MNKIKSIVLVVLAALTLYSCQLERLDYTQIRPEDFYKTETDLRLAVNALYFDFATGTWNGEAIYGPDGNGYQILSDMTTDALWCCWGWDWDEMRYHQWTVTMTGKLQGNIYNAFAHYNYLSKARNVIRRIEACGVDQAAKDRYAAEAKALRGWMGLYLYDFFGPVPVASDEVLDNPQEFVYLPRLTDKQYDQMMEEDLGDAIKYLPEKAERGRLTQGAARMILLKYYMIRGKFNKAEALARELYEMEGVYSLQPDYNYVFSKEGVGNNEIILQLACNSSASWLSNILTAEVLPADYPWTENSQGWGGYVIPWDFYNTFEENDTRRKNIITEYETAAGVKKTKENSSQLYYGALPLKYGKDPQMQGAYSSIDVVVYRYSDVLLTLAECINRNQGVPTEEAIGLVNRVRARAGLEALTPAQTASYTAFNDALLMERGHEFYLEGLRRQDLIRFGKYVEYANDRIDEANAADESKGYFNVDDSHERFFIPQTFINESKSAIKQNEGW